LWGPWWPWDRGERGSLWKRGIDIVRAENVNESMDESVWMSMCMWDVCGGEWVVCQ
jgi:hypothetical protein